MVLPVNGTREGLFAFVQAAVDASRPAPAVLMPNPFYQIYEGAALLAGAEPVYLNCDAANGYLPDLDARGRGPGTAARCCSCAAPAIRPARSCRRRTCAARSNSRSGTGS